MSLLHHLIWHKHKLFYCKLCGSSENECYQYESSDIEREDRLNLSDESLSPESLLLEEDSYLTWLSNVAISDSVTIYPGSLKLYVALRRFFDSMFNC